MKRSLSMALVLCLFLAAMPAIGIDGYPKTIVDSSNRSIIFDNPADRIVPIVAWSYEPLYILGAQDKIVGVEKGSKAQYAYLPGIGDRSVVGTYREPDYEKIIELKPDLVIVQPKYLAQVDEKLTPLGINVVCLPFNQQSAFDGELCTLADILGPEEKERAHEFISWKKSTLESLKKDVDKIDASSRIRVYGEWSDTPWYTGSKLSGLDDVITLAGGDNIAGPLNPEENLSLRYPTVDPEWVLKENPQAIIFPAFDYFTGYLQQDANNATQLIQQAKVREGLNKTDAVRNDRLYVLDAYLVEAVRGFIGAQYLARLFYPEEMADLDPEAVHKEYYESWLHVPYQGLWTYPEAK